MERVEQKHVPQAGMLKVTSPHAFFIVKNIGTGPALNLSFNFAPIDSKDSASTEPSRYARRFPYIGPKEGMEATIGPELVSHGDYRFTASYESLSHKRYLTEMILHARSAQTTVLRDDWIFKTVRRGRRQKKHDKRSET
jgi:hypothetical protein